jgi:hypothetical protein
LFQIVPNTESDPTGRLGYGGKQSLLESLEHSSASHGIPWRQSISGQSKGASPDHDDLVALLLHCALKVHALLFARRYEAGFGLPYWDPNIAFPSLKTLGIILADGNYYFSEMRDFFLYAPNIETLYACDAGGWYEPHYDSNKRTEFMYYPSDDLGLQNLRKLRLEGLTPPNTCALTESLCANLLETYLGLQDFEYYWDDYELGIFSLDDLLSPEMTVHRLSVAHIRNRG